MSESNKGAEPVRQAAAVILLRARPGSGALEILLQSRHRKASFMASAFVFPGGTADPDETDPRVTAARELFEEAGVLLARARGPGAGQPGHGAGVVSIATSARQRRDLHAGTRAFADILAEADLDLDLDALRYFAHWITPSVERKRFSARFYLACLPPGQEATPDDAETVDTIWVTPDQALARAAELRLPPPQLRIFLELREAARDGVDAVLAMSAARAAHAHAILPRGAEGESRPTLLLPWDPEYRSAGIGEALDMPAGHPLAVGPSRFVLEDMTWRHLDAPSSPIAE